MKRHLIGMFVVAMTAGVGIAQATGVPGQGTWETTLQARDLTGDGVTNPSQEQYVMGAVHTNTIEGFWSLIKRGIVGTYHKVSKKYLPLCVSEFQFRYNNRKNEDIFRAAIRVC